MKHYASNEQIDRGRQLRRASTDAEMALWNKLRARQIAGYKFRRQHRVNGYYLDFACEELKIAIELDGGQHNEAKHAAYDAIRSAALAKSGWHVLRFWNNDVVENIESVVQVIHDALTRNHEG